LGSTSIRATPRPRGDLEETSHWIAVVWHAAQARPVSALLLELQADVDRYAVARTAHAPDPLQHFAQLRLHAGLSPRSAAAIAPRTPLRSAIAARSSAGSRTQRTCRISCASCAGSTGAPPHRS
jgi:hypothetical protein